MGGICSKPGDVAQGQAPSKGGGESAAPAERQAGPKGGTERKGDKPPPSTGPEKKQAQENDEVHSAEMWRLLGWDQPRAERAGWQEGLHPGAAPDEAAAAEQDVVDAITLGRPTAAQWRPPSRCIRFFLGGTSSDTPLERNVLLDDVMPYLDEYARARDLRCVLTEMRWGGREEDAGASADACLEEIRRCQEESASISYVLLMGNKYGHRPGPHRIPRQEMEDLMRHVADEQDKDAVLGAYKLDTNHLEGGGVYVSVSSSKEAGSLQVAQRALRKAALALWPEAQAELREPSSTHRIKQYVMSVTESEALAGLFALPEAQRDSAAFAFQRTFKKLPKEPSPQLGDYADMSGDAADADALALLGDFSERMVPGALSSSRRIAYAPLEWGPGVQCTKHAEYLRKFADDFCSMMAREVDAAVARARVRLPEHALEAHRHLRFAHERNEALLEMESSKVVAHTLAKYARSDDGGALAIYAEPGAGTTSLCARFVCEELERAELGGSVVIARFLGTTAESIDAAGLLRSVCAQLRAAYAREEDVPVSLKDLAGYFRRLLAAVPRGRPLTLVLDSVDRLSDADAGRRLEWLPLTAREVGSCYVHLVVSTAEAEGAPCLAMLRARLKGPALLHVPLLSGAEALLHHALNRRGRTITDAQREAVLRGSGHTPTLLYVHVAALAAAGLRSWDEHAFPPSVPELAASLLQRCEAECGASAVASAAAYLTLAREGLSEGELQGLLSLHDDALAEAYALWVPPLRIMPPLVVARLLAALAPHLATRWQGLRTWSHGQLAEGASQRYLADGAQRRQRHVEMADFFGGRFGGDARKPYSARLREVVQRTYPLEAAGCRRAASQPLVFAASVLAPGCRPNARRAREHVRQLVLGGCEAEAVGQLCDLEVLAAKLLAEGDAGPVLHELASAQRAFPASAAALHPVKAFVGRHAAELAAPAAAPNAILQLALQEPVASPVYRSARSKPEALRRHCFQWVGARPSRPDPCLLTISQHADSVRCVVWGAGDAAIISGSSSGLIKVCDPLSGEAHLTIAGHSGSVWSLALSPDGLTLASGDSSGDVLFWDPEHGTAQGQPLRGAHSAPVYSLTYASGGALLVSCGGDAAVRVWNAAERTPHCAPLFHDQRVIFDVAVLRAAPPVELVSAGAEKVSLWSVETGHETASPLDAHQTVRGLAVAPSGRQMATVGYKRMVQFWDNGQDGAWTLRKGTPKAHSGFVQAVAYSGDGRWVASGGWDSTIVLWDPERGVPLGAPLLGHAGMVMALRFSGDSAQLVSAATDGSVRLWDVAGFDRAPPTALALVGDVVAADGAARAHALMSPVLDAVPTLSASGHWSARFGPDGSECFTGGIDGKVRVWDVSSLQLKEEPWVGHSGMVTDIRVHPSGIVGTASGDGSVRLWAREKGRAVSEGERAVLRGHGEGDGVAVFGFSPDGDAVFTGGQDCEIALWDFATRKQRQRLKGHSQPVWTAMYSADGARIFSADYGGEFRVWDAASGDLLAKPELNCRRFQVAPNGRQLVCSTGDSAFVFVDTDTLIAQRPMRGHKSSVFCFAYSHDCALLATGGDDRSVIVWGVQQRESVCTLQGHAGSVRSVSFGLGASRDLLLSADDQKFIIVWDVAERRMRGAPLYVHDCGAQFVSLTHDSTLLAFGDAGGRVHVSPIQKTEEPETAVSWPEPGTVPLAAAFNPNKGLLATGGWEGAVRVWKWRMKKIVGVCVGHTAPVRGVVFSPDGERIATCSDDMTVRVWDTTTRKEFYPSLQGHNGWVKSLAFSPNGEVLVSGGDDGTVRIWSCAKGALIKESSEVPRPSLRSLAFNEAGDSFLSGWRDGTVAIWDAEGAKVKSSHSISTEGHLRAVGFLSPTLILSASPERNAELTPKTQIRLWDSRQSGCVGAFFPPAPLACMAVGGGVVCYGDTWGGVHLLQASWLAIQGYTAASADEAARRGAQ